MQSVHTSLNNIIITYNINFQFMTGPYAGLLNCHKQKAAKKKGKET
jgi:hypothetical protein